MVNNAVDDNFAEGFYLAAESHSVVSGGTAHSPDFPISGTVHLSGKFPIKVLGIVYEVNFGLVRDIRIIRLACNFKTPFHILSDGGG